MEKEGKKERERVRMKERNPLRDWYHKERKSVRKFNFHVDFFYMDKEKIYQIRDQL